MGEMHKGVIGLMGVLALAGCAAAMTASGPAQASEARYEYVEYRGAEPPRAPEGTYRNPILPGFHPDPSVVKVGADFYLVNSTFSWFPGVPVFHSRDLVNWRLIGHAITRESQASFRGLGTNRGIFAPAISWHDGLFYMVTTCIGCGGNFYVTATDPAGPWSEPVWLDFEGIDPSLFFDDDGRAWMVNNGLPEGEPRYEGHRAIWVQEFDIASGQLTGPRKMIVDGGVHPEDEPIWAEGPHLYKVDGWYYLMPAEGGTAEQHSQTIYRAKEPMGPYEPGPFNPILTQRDLDPDRPDRVEATGHADLVQLDDGSWWGVFLATRPFAGQSTLLGRESFLLPVRWVDGWPRFLDEGEYVPLLVEKPALPESPGTNWTGWREEFDGAALGGEWISLRAPITSYRLANGALVLAPGADAAGTLGVPSFIGQRMRHHEAAVETTVDFAPAAVGDFAGLMAFMDETHFIALGIEGTGTGREVTLRRRIAAEQPERGEVLAHVPISASGAIELSMAIKGGSADFAWRRAGESEWRELAAGVDVEPMASIHAGLFTGVVIGPYAYAAR
ncbi:MAG TPA: glycoside hydrolase family 43 protein [Alteraurantiacibacter sp.]